MNSVINYLRGKKTYIVATLLVVVSGLHAQGYLSSEQLDLINTALVGLGFAALRLGMAKK